MGTKTIHSCDNCEDKIDGSPMFEVAWVDWLANFIPIPMATHKIFCSFNCLAAFVESEHKRRIDSENAKGK